MKKFGFAGLFLGLFSINALAAPLAIEGLYDHASFVVKDNGKTNFYNRPSKTYISFSNGSVTTYTFSGDGKSVEIDRDAYRIQDNRITIIEDKSNPCMDLHQEDGILDGNHLVAKLVASGLELSQENKSAHVAMTMNLIKTSSSEESSLSQRVNAAQKACVDSEGNTTKTLN